MIFIEDDRQHLVLNLDYNSIFILFMLCSFDSNLDRSEEGSIDQEVKINCKCVTLQVKQRLWHLFMII